MSSKNGNAGLSGQQVAARNVERLQKWIDEQETAGDWADYIRGDKLNRTEIASECGFGRSVFSQNPAVASMLDALEARLAERKILKPGLSLKSPPENADAELVEIARSADAASKKAMATKAILERRVKSLEEKCAVLSAGLKAANEKNRQYKMIEDILQSTGRMPMP
jgi:hypothetical protein